MVRHIFQFLIGILFTFIPAVSLPTLYKYFLVLPALVCVYVCMYVRYFGEKIQAFMVLNKTIFSWLNKAFLFLLTLCVQSSRFLYFFSTLFLYIYVECLFLCFIPCSKNMKYYGKLTINWQKKLILYNHKLFDSFWVVLCKCC